MMLAVVLTAVVCTQVAAQGVLAKIDHVVPVTNVLRIRGAKRKCSRRGGSEAVILAVCSLKRERRVLSI